MKVYQLISELANLPAGHDIFFHTLCEKKKTEQVKSYSDDTSLFEVDFQDLEINYDVTDAVMLTSKN